MKKPRKELKGSIKKTWTTTGTGDSFFVTIELFGEGNYGINFIRENDEIILIHKSKKS